MGRLLATPTFLTGACFVLVAAMAYGTAQPHLLYSEPSCQAARCSVVTPHQNGGVTLKTTARPELGSKQSPAHSGRVHQAEGVPSSAGDGGSHASHPAGAQHVKTPQPPPAPPTPPTSMGGGHPGPRVAILFHTVKRWHGGFIAAITIANHSNSALDGWQLWLRYRITEINWMWGARWFPDSAQARNAGLVAPPASAPKVKPGANERFTFRASGTPAAPVGCSFDGYHCTFKTITGGGNQTSGNHHKNTSGGKLKPGTKQDKS
jgi:hypothetical protein